MSKSLLDLENVLRACNGVVIGNASECCFTSVATDSRNVVKDTLFVPLIGEFQNGHKYIPMAVKAGASVVLVNKNENLSEYASENGVVYIAVENTLYALQAIAKAYAGKVASDMIRVSITGSSGKTTTKEMLVAVCKEHFGENAVAYTKGNFNSETGLPLSMFQIRGDEKIGIFEMGMNRVNEIGEISAVWQSQYGIITNIGNAHIGILGSRENIALEKRKSFDYIPSTGAAFVPAEDDFASVCLEKVCGEKVLFGKNVPETVSGVKFVEDLGFAGTKFLLDGVEITLPLAGEYNYVNALGVIALSKKLGISADEIKAGLEKMAAVNGRMEVKKALLKSGVNATVVCDCYNANPDSMIKVIDFCSNLKDAGQKIFVLGDMKELGTKSAEEHVKVGKAVVRAKADYVVLAGPEMLECKKTIEEENTGICVEYSKTNDDAFFTEAAQKILACAGQNAVILIKGSHSMALEKIIPLIMAEGKEAAE